MFLEENVEFISSSVADWKALQEALVLLKVCSSFLILVRLLINSKNLNVHSFGIYFYCVHLLSIVKRYFLKCEQKHF